MMKVQDTTEREISRSSAVPGERWEVESLYREYSDQLTRYLLRLLGDREEASDALHDTFLKVVIALPSLKQIYGTPSSWLYRIATTTALDRLRRRKTAQRYVITRSEQWLMPSLPAGEESDPLASLVLKDSLWEALSAFSSQDRAALLLIHEEGYSTKEVAHRLLLRPPTLRKRLSRACSKLQDDFALNMQAEPNRQKTLMHKEGKG